MEVEELEVIVVDDHLAMRRGIELLLREAGFRIVGTAGTLDEARTMLSRRRFDVALLDVQLGQESSLGLVEDLLRGDPTAPIVLYTGYTSSDRCCTRPCGRGRVGSTSARGRRAPR
jgi:DNA-binding NarL/FixJ family response regulator